MKENWIKIEENLPPIDEMLLICIDNNIISFGRYGAFYKDTERCFYNEGIDDRKITIVYGENAKVTHWQLLEKP